MKTMGVDVRNSLSHLPPNIPYSERVLYTDTQTHVFINTKIHMQTHIYIYAWFCALHSAKPTKVQEEKADMLAKL